LRLAIVYENLRWRALKIVEPAFDRFDAARDDRVVRFS
jgi:hypothetical protein